MSFAVIESFPVKDGDRQGQEHRAMIGKPNSRPAFNVNPLRKQWVVAAIGLLFAFALQSFDVRAELLFRSVEQAGGQVRWSPIRKYSEPSHTAHARDSGNAVEEVRVFLSGEITRADLDSAAVMEGLVKSGRQKITGNTVWLASNGGDIDAGMELGRRLRKLGVFTLIGKNDQCLSACVFAFMGGERRSVAGRLGIHRPYFPFTDGGPGRHAKFRHLEQALKAFVAELDFPDSLYEAVMLVPPESMQIVGPAELKRFYLEGISPLTEDELDAASARRRNLSMYEYLKYKATAPACNFFEAGERTCEGKVREAVVSGGAADDPGIMRTGASTPADLVDPQPAGGLTRARKPVDANSRDPA
jgi:hypothetical protein